MIRTTALACLLLLAACNRDQATLTPDADAELRNATAAKTLADVTAAEEAAGTPLPTPLRPSVAPTPSAPPDASLAAPPADLPANEVTPPR